MVEQDALYVWRRRQLEEAIERRKVSSGKFEDEGSYSQLLLILKTA